MSGPAESTLEEASRCPRCEQAGKYVGERSLRDPRQGKLKVFSCENTRCKWYNTTWTIQVAPNGTIPPPTLEREKRFKKLPDDGGRTLETIERQLKAETKAGAELNRPR